VDTFSEMGLPPLPTRERSLWYNGDYVFHHLAAELDADYFLMFEGDCAVLGPLDGIIDRLLEDRIDFAAHDLGRRYPEWVWYDNAAAYYGKVIQGCIYYAVWIGRTTVGSLLEGRLSMKAAMDAGQLQDWVFCEGYTATHLLRSGVRWAPLERYVNLDRATAMDPLHYDEIFNLALPAGETAIFHPIYVSPEFERRTIARLKDKVRHLRNLFRFWRPRNWPYYRHLMREHWKRFTGARSPSRRG
jgi:hypothetical protein